MQPIDITLEIKNFGDIYWTMEFTKLKSMSVVNKLIEIHGANASSISIYFYHNMHGGIWGKNANSSTP